MSERQEFIDSFYMKHGPCCAGCDWWRHFNSRAGECTRSAPGAGNADRVAMLGISWSSRQIGAGHVMTRRDHLCGEFADTFDWAGLPLGYRRQIGQATP